jgi:Tol biopolymer transport system component
MASLDEHFRALETIRPPAWPELGDREPRSDVLRHPIRRRLVVAALALAVAAGGLILVVRAFRAEPVPPAPASTVGNGVIAFSRGGSDAGLYAVSPDGTGLRRLTTEASNTAPAWSPDGSTIAFVRGFIGERDGIYVMDADGTHPRRLTDGGTLVDGSDLGPAWSPDGTRIAFAREGREERAETGNADIYVVNTDGTNLFRLTNGPVMEYEPSWSPDGSRIAFEGYDLASGGQPPSPLRLYVMNADGTNVRELGPENVQGPAWSPDGSEIAYVDTETGSIMAVRPDGSGLRRILDVAELVGGVHLVYDVAWSPDGTKLAFMAGPDAEDTHIYVVDRDGSDLTQLTDDPAPDASPAWQPVLVADESPTPEATVLPEGTISLPADAVPEGTLLLRTDAGAEILSAGSERSRLVPGIRTPLELSPDSSMVLGSNGSPGSPANELVSVDLRTGQRRVLARSGVEDVLGTFAQWSPDGSMVAYTLGARDPADQSTLCVVAIGQPEPRCFPDVGRVYTFDWDPDGGRLVVAGPPIQPVRILDLSTGEVTEVAPQEGAGPINDAIRDARLGTSFQLVAPRWSPSGTYLGALANLKDSNVSYVPVVFTPEGQFVAFGRPSGEFPEPFEWSPTADLLAYTRGDAPYRITEAYLLDSATGKDHALVANEDAEPFVITRLAWSPSEDWIAAQGWRNEGGGYFQVSLRIIDAADPTSFREFPVDAGETVDFLVDWAP